MLYEVIFKIMLTLMVVAESAKSMSEQDIPKQMKRIYRRFKQGKLPRKGINAVRCIHAHPESASSNGKLLFNLDAMHKQESLIKAEIYFYRRSQEAADMLQTDFYEISPYYQSLVQTELIKSGIEGWVHIDITPTIKQCTNTVNTNNQLAVSYYTINGEKQTKSIDVSKFTRHHGLPFLLVYTNNSRSIDMDQISGLNEQEVSDELIEPINSIIGSNRVKRAMPNKAELADGKKMMNLKLVELDRKMNQISSGFNMWEGVDDYFNELTNSIEPGPENKLTHYQVQVDDPMPFTVQSVTTTNPPKNKATKPKLQLLPWPKVVKKKPTKEKADSQDIIPTTWGKPGATDKKQNNGCRRESLRLNFEDIGWGLRIIEPKKYDAYYCTGQCGFPFSLGMKPTNHATLQSILSSLQRSRSVPEPCCVADRLSPLTLMFRDISDDIVVKQYENMVVESCSCR